MKTQSDRTFQKDIQIVNASHEYEFLAGAAATATFLLLELSQVL